MKGRPWGMKGREVARMINSFNENVLGVCVTFPFPYVLCVKHEHSNRHSPCLQGV